MKKIVFVLGGMLVMALGASDQKRRIARSSSFDVIGSVKTIEVLNRANTPVPECAAASCCFLLCLPGVKTRNFLRRIDWLRIFLDSQLSS